MSLIPVLPDGPAVKEDGYLTDNFKHFFDVLLQNLRQGISDEGFLNPSQPQGNVDVIEPEALPGIVLFNTEIVNGGSSGSPNGQLQVRLRDGTFHNITNT